MPAEERLVSQLPSIDSPGFVPAVYRELRQLAQLHLSKMAPGQSIQATELVHEAYLRLVGSGRADYESTRQYFFVASRAMHDILVERARRRARLRRGGDRRRVDLDNLVLADDVSPTDLLALDESLERLERDSPAKHQVLLLRFFGGLTAEQTAQAMGISLRTVERQWRYIRARLHRELSSL